MLDIEKNIDKYTSSFTQINDYHKRLIKNGQNSYLNCRYGINIDNYEYLLGFRSEFDLKRRTCPEQIKLEKEAEIPFYEKVKAGETDYQDIDEFTDIVLELKKQSLVCNECMKNNYGRCKIENENELIENIYENRNRTRFRVTRNIEHLQEYMMTEVREAVNNNFSMFRSYSKYLAAPLFKYANDGVLYINNLVTNTVNTDIIISFFDWYDHFDMQGNKENRYYEERIDLLIPLRLLGSKEELYKLIFPNIEEADRDIDNIELEINGLTIDISEIKRANFDKYYYEHYEDWMKRFASYKKDKEILTTDEYPDYVISNKKILQVIRFLYLLKISSFNKDSIEDFSKKVLDNNCLEINITDQEKDGIRIIRSYLEDEQNIIKEREQYRKLYEDNKKYHYDWYNSDGIKNFFQNILSKPDLYKGVFEQQTLEELLKIVMEG